MEKNLNPNLLGILKQRYDRHMNRHPGLNWQDVQARIGSHPRALESLAAMEHTGGEPDVVVWPNHEGHIVFCDCAAESPSGRRSLCFDGQALDARKENKPVGSATQMAAKMGIALLTEEQYRALQLLGEFDIKTSSWIHTPDDLRALGGALFGDRRYGRVFTYHNGAQSYYAARGFRGSLVI